MTIGLADAMRKIAFISSTLAAIAAVVGALYARYDIHTVVDAAGVVAAALLAVASTATFARTARTLTLAALLQLGIAFLLFGLSPNAQVGIAWLPAMTLFTASAILLLSTVPRRDWSPFGFARGVGTLLAALVLFIGISELAAGLGPSGHLLRDLLVLSPLSALVVGPLLGWLGGAGSPWAARCCSASTSGSPSGWRAVANRAARWGRLATCYSSRCGRSSGWSTCGSGGGITHTGKRMLARTYPMP